ncbi:DUF3108 domain-containing protein [Bizionia sp. KMM 8389]
MRYLYLLFCFVISQTSFSQNTAISNNETLKFTAAYNMSGIMTDLAEVTMATNAIKTSKATLLQLKCTATTYSKWDSFFKIRDLYESYVSPTTLKPYLYKRDINEGGYYKFMQYKYIHKTNTIESIKKKKRSDGGIWEEKKNINFGNNTADIVTTIYKIRNLNLSEASNGTQFPLMVVFDNTEFKITATYLGTESINTSLGNKTCHKLSIAVNNSDVLKGTNNNLLWLTADANKIPVFAKFKIAVGNGELRIKSATGLKH